MAASVQAGQQMGGEEEGGEVAMLAPQLWHREAARGRMALRTEGSWRISDEGGRSAVAKRPSWRDLSG